MAVNVKEFRCLVDVILIETFRFLAARTPFSGLVICFVGHLFQEGPFKT